MKQVAALPFLFAILGSYWPFQVASFVNPNDTRRVRVPSGTHTVSAGSVAKKQLVRKFMSEQDNDGDEKKPPIPPPTPPMSDVSSGKDDQELEIPSEETIEAERPRVPVPEPPPPPPKLAPPPMPKLAPPPMPKLQLNKEPTEPSRSLTPDEEKLAVASGLGGLFVGALVGVLIDFEYPNIDLTMSPILPPIFSAIVVSTVGYAFGGSEGGLGKVVRALFGGPTVFVGSVITSAIDAAIDNAVTSAKNKVKETTDEIVAIPGKIADEIVATPGRVADAAVETATEIAEEIKATPGKVADAAVETATEIADEIKATPGRVAKQTKQAVEDVVDDTLDAVEDFVEDVKAIPTKAINSVESALGVSKPSSPRPPLVGRTDSKLTPLPPKDLPGSVSKPAEEKSFIPSITSLKIPELPKPPANIPKLKAAPPKKQLAKKNFPPDRKPVKKDTPKFELPKFDISKASKGAVTKEKVQYSFPSETPPTKTEAPKFELPKFGSPPKKAAEVDTRSADIALKRKKEAEAKATAKRLREEDAKRKRIEAAEKAEEVKRQRQLQAEEKAAKEREAAAERRRIQEEKEAQRIAAAEKAEEIKRQKQIEAKEKAAKMAQEAAERRRLQEQLKQEKIEAQRQAAEKRRQDAEERRLQLAEKAKRKEDAAKSLGQAKSRTTISLGNLFGGNLPEKDTKVNADIAKPKNKLAPKGVPIVSNWKQNPDGSISGTIASSPDYSDGTFITTSSVPQGATSNSIVKTSSGSNSAKYGFTPF